MGMMSEFKEFISKGNVLDLAVGLILGTAFGKIVSSFVEGIIMPPIGYYLMGGVDFKDVKTVLQAAGADAAKQPEVAIQWGSFLNTIIIFLIIAFVIFQIVKAYNRMKAATPPAAPSSTDVLLMEIRDSLKK